MPRGTPATNYISALQVSAVFAHGWHMLDGGGAKTTTPLLYLQSRNAGKFFLFPAYVPIQHYLSHN